jgi:hypothetical protein
MLNSIRNYASDQIEQYVRDTAGHYDLESIYKIVAQDVLSTRSNSISEKRSSLASAIELIDKE